MNTCLPGTTLAAEVCGNGTDDDCDLLVDDRDPECMSGCARREDCTSPADDDCDGAVNEEDYYDCIDSGWGCWPGTGFVAVQCNWWCVPHCFDGWQDGNEGDVDCGGACDAKCASGQHCWSPFDCASGVCLNDVCA